MPKLYSELDCKTSFYLECETKLNIRALSLFWNMGGDFSKAIRHILNESVKSILAGMNQEDKNRFDKILENMRIQEQNALDKISEGE